MPQQGDILLFYGKSTLWDRLICFATQGSFSHCEIAIDEQRMIGATLSGVDIHGIPEAAAYAKITVSAYTTPQKITEALLWALQQRSDAYGWSDILFQVIKFLFPPNPFRWGIVNHFDCSDYACRYLIHAGVDLPDQFLDSYTIAPNDLARWAGIPTSKKEVSHV